MAAIPQRPNSSKGVVRETAARYYSYPNRVILDRRTYHRQEQQPDVPSLTETPRPTAYGVPVIRTYGSVLTDTKALKLDKHEGMGAPYGLRIGAGQRLKNLAEIGVGTGTDQNELYMHDVDRPDIDLPSQPLEPEEPPTVNPSHLEPMFQPPTRQNRVLTNEERKRQEMSYHLTQYPMAVKIYENTDASSEDTRSLSSSRPRSLSDIDRRPVRFVSRKEKLFSKFLSRRYESHSVSMGRPQSRPKSAHFGNRPPPTFETTGAWRSQAWWPVSTHKNVCRDSQWGSSIKDLRKRLNEFNQTIRRTVRQGRSQRPGFDFHDSQKEEEEYSNEYIEYVPSPVDQRIADTYISTKAELESMVSSTYKQKNRQLQQNRACFHVEHSGTSVEPKVSFKLAPEDNHLSNPSNDNKRAEGEYKGMKAVDEHLQVIGRVRRQVIYGSVFQ